MYVIWGWKMFFYVMRRAILQSSHHDFRIYDLINTITHMYFHSENTENCKFYFSTKGVLTMVYDARDWCIFEPRLSIGILNNTKHHLLSEPGIVSVLEWGVGDTYSTGSFIKNWPMINVCSTRHNRAGVSHPFTWEKKHVTFLKFWVLLTKSKNPVILRFHFASTEFFLFTKLLSM
jgi:hypothetical protein